MTPEEIIAMAREAGFRTGHIDLTTGEPIPFIAPASGTSCMWEVLRFAALVAAKRNEENAQLCESVAKQWEFHLVAPSAALQCAADIRARGTKDGV